jgi:hypothetical protein
MRILLIIALLLIVAVPTFAQAPEPTPTPIVIPDQEMYESLGEADQALGELDNPLDAPDGTSIVPDEDGGMIFSYAKWLMSPVGAAELFGPFEGIATHMAVFFAMRFALMGLLGVIYVATYLIRWVVWIFKLLLLLINALGGIIDLIGGVLGKGLGWIIKFIGG